MSERFEPPVSMNKLVGDAKANQERQNSGGESFPWDSWRELREQVERLHSPEGLPLREATELSEGMRYLIAGHIATFAAYSEPMNDHLVSWNTKTRRPDDIIVRGWAAEKYTQNYEDVSYRNYGASSKPIPGTTRVSETVVLRPDYHLNGWIEETYNPVIPGGVYQTDNHSKDMKHFWPFSYPTYTEDRVARLIAEKGYEWVEPAPETYQ